MDAASQRVGERAVRTRHFRELQIWQKGMQLALDIYTVTETFPKRETFGISSQIRRAAVSVPSNIAEGHGRLSDAAFRIFLGHARGSLFELQTQLELAAGLGYPKADIAANLNCNCEEIARMLNGLLRALKKVNEAAD